MSSSFTQWLNWLKSRSLLRGYAHPRRPQRRRPFVSQMLRLEDRCLPAAPVLTATAGNLSQVIFNDPGVTALNKTITIINNSNYTEYPILTDANSTFDPNGPKTNLAAAIADATSTTIKLANTALTASRTRRVRFFPTVLSISKSTRRS